MTAALQTYIAERIGEFDRVAADRRAALARIADYVRSSRHTALPARLMFICTHNSRRSQLAQLWAHAAATRYGVENVFVYSGGTESTAFNPRAVAAARRAGFDVEQTGEADNPIYLVRYALDAPPVVCFSKLYDSPPNPRQGFCAVMVCTDADARCPLVPGVATRVALPFDDPKALDGTPGESAAYDERCRDIARELLWVFAELARP